MAVGLDMSGDTHHMSCISSPDFPLRLPMAEQQVQDKADRTALEAKSPGAASQPSSAAAPAASLGKALLSPGALSPFSSAASSKAVSQRHSPELGESSALLGPGAAQELQAQYEEQEGQGEQQQQQEGGGGKQ